jgi:carbon-monoxide dehydrogenase large subunit
VSVYTGSSSIGQGLETVFAQIAADALSIPLDAIRGVFHGSTSAVTEGFGAYSSRSVVMGGSAIIEAARELRHMMAETPDKRPLEAEASFSSNKRTYSYGAHAAHVAVDPQTGHVQVIDYVAVEDVGRIVNPATLHGQTVGAIVQGLGGVLLEHLAYSDDGQLLTGSLADYVMPSAMEFPNIRVVALEDYPSPNNPLGAKGAGEGGIIPVAGVIANAVAAALRPLGVEPRELPLSPPRVWEMINRRGPASPA